MKPTCELIFPSPPNSPLSARPYARHAMGARPQEHKKFLARASIPQSPLLRLLCFCLFCLSVLLLLHARNLTLRQITSVSHQLAASLPLTVTRERLFSPAQQPPVAAAPVTTHVQQASPPQGPAPLPEGLPPRLAPLHFLTPGDPRLPALAQQPFVSPRVLTSYIRPSARRPAGHELFLFTSSLFRRNLTVSHCAVGARLVPAASYADDVTMCELDKLPAPGTPLSVALRHDAHLQQTLDGPVAIAHGFDTRLREGDLTRLPTGQFRARSSVEFNPALVDPGRAPLADARDKPPRFPVCLATMNRIGTHMLPDWVDHYRRLGVDHVFVLDNGADPPIATTSVGRRHDVEVMPWPWPKSQLLAFSYALVAAAPRCERLMLADVDEFLMLGLGDTPFARGRRPLHALTRRVAREGFPNMLIHDVVMVNSGYTKRPTGHVAELYLHASAKAGHKYGKSICALDEGWASAMVHTCGWKRGRVYPRIKAPSDAQVASKHVPVSPADTPVLVHFYWRSWEERVQKWRTGRGSFFDGVIEKRDALRFEVDKPNPLYVQVDGRPHVMRYTAFRDFWRRVRALAWDRVRECVVATVRDGQRTTRVVELDVRVEE